MSAGCDTSSKSDVEVVEGQGFTKEQIATIARIVYAQIERYFEGKGRP